MKSLVIGAESFAGKFLCEYLENLHETVIKENIFETNESYCFEGLIKKELPDRVFFLSSVDSISYAWEHSNEVVIEHVTKLLNILEILRNLDKIIPIVLVGSGEEYGFVGYNNIPIKEEMHSSPQNIYAVSKVCQNMLAQLYCKAYSMNIIIARVFNEIGPGQSERFVVSNICKQIVKIKKGKQKKILFLGNINITRDFIDVRDSVKALIELSKTGKKNNVYNVASGKGMRIRDIVSLIKQITKMDFDICVEENRVRLNDIPVLEADISKIITHTSWSPAIPFVETLKDMINYWEIKYK